MENIGPNIWLICMGINLIFEFINIKYVSRSLKYKDVAMFIWICIICAPLGLIYYILYFGIKIDWNKEIINLNKKEIDK